MSTNPFTADVAIRDRIAEVRRASGDAISREVAAFIGARGGSVADNFGSVIPAAEVARMGRAYGLSGPEELILAALPAVEKLARPPISGYFVGCMGLEAGTGNIVLGGNLEFPKTHLGLTVHGEGFVFMRAFSRDTAIKTIAIREAHPCAHCRQFLSEFAATADMTLIDPLGHRLRMAEIYPWPFDPAYLGDRGVVVGDRPFETLELQPHRLGHDVADRLLDAGRRSHAPYSKCPGAVALTLADGSVVTGSAIESVAFNPTMTPLPAAIINVFAHGYGYGDITAAALGTVEGGAVDYTRTTSELLAAIAPDAQFTVVGWRQ